MDFKKIQKILFYLLIFLIPSNLGKHWVFNWSYVNGILVDYLIPTLYLTDILIILILVLWLISLHKSQIKQSILKYPIFKYFLTGLILALFTIYSLMFTKNPYAGIYKLIKLIEMGLLVLYIKNNINIKKDSKKISYALSLALIFQAILAIWQWFKQSSVFGYYFFGEQPYSLTSLGIKKISWFGVLKAVPLATFPHANVLAGFLLISLLLIINSNAKIKLYRNPLYRNPGVAVNKISRQNNATPGLRWGLRWLGFCSLLLECLPLGCLLLGCLLLGLTALFLTFSYYTWLALGLLFFVLLIKKFIDIKKSKMFVFFSSLFALLLMIVISYFALKTAIDCQSIQRRLALNKIAFKMWLSSPFFGIGLNNFIPKMEEFGLITGPARFLQPAHNIYFLLLAETGIIGMSLFFWLIAKISKKLIKEKNYFLLLIFCLMLFLGLFDHYFLTLQQGMLLASFVLGISLKKN